MPCFCSTTWQHLLGSLYTSSLYVWYMYGFGLMSGIPMCNVIPLETVEITLISWWMCQPLKVVPTTIEELKKIIMQCRPQSCPLDPIPTSLIKKCFESMLPILARLVNLSFASSTFPDDFKIFMVIPLLKTLLLDQKKQNKQQASVKSGFCWQACWQSCSETFECTCEYPKPWCAITVWIQSWA